jgi:Cu2+-exporting ATPase
VTAEADDGDLLEYVASGSDGARRLHLAVPDAYCATCIQTIEEALAGLPGVCNARVNLQRRRVQIDFEADCDPATLTDTVTRSGYRNHPIDPADVDDKDPALRELVSALVVSGFASAHTMFFSEAIWSGVEGDTRTLFYWISALVAIPAVAYAGRPFFRSALAALRVGRANMDVPIAIALIATTGISVLETRLAGQHAYFDAATMLLFFLLIGRTLDHLMRERARNAITGLARLQPRGGTVVAGDGRREYVKLNEIVPGMTLEIKAGERIPVDSTLLSNGASFDYSIVTGESLPHLIEYGSEVIGGAASLSGPLLVRTKRAAPDSYLARMAAMMDAAETAKTRPRRIADRAASLYAPVVHTIAIATFLAWGVLGGDWHAALMNAVTVLIITCPCALALAVPIVHVVAAGQLFERGVLMKDGAALERIAEVDSVAFDKTGTLTEGRPRLVSTTITDDRDLSMAASLAAASTHPLSRAIARSIEGRPAVLASVSEIAGMGVEARLDGAGWRLGSAAWCGAKADGSDGSVWLSRNDQLLGCFTFEDLTRAEARAAVEQLGKLGLAARLLSGDGRSPVLAAARDAGIETWRYGLTPEDKLADVAQARTLMVGDGINDAPALRAAYASMAPSSAADIGRTAADFVITGDDLTSVPFAIRTARGASRIVVENLAIAIGYNAIAVPLAISGNVTPLVAAVAMSSSSLIVVINALRLRWSTRGNPRGAKVFASPAERFA